MVFCPQVPSSPRDWWYASLFFLQQLSYFAFVDTRWFQDVWFLVWTLIIYWSVLKTHEADSFVISKLNFSIEKIRINGFYQLKICSFHNNGFVCFVSWLVKNLPACWRKQIKNHYRGLTINQAPIYCISPSADFGEGLRTLPPLFGRKVSPKKVVFAILWLLLPLYRPTGEQKKSPLLSKISRSPNIFHNWI